MTGDDDPDVGEHLPGQDRPPARQRTRILSAVIGSAILVASVVVLAVRHNDSAPSADPTSPVPSRLHLPTDPSSSATSICASGAACQVLIGVPHAVTLAAKLLGRGALVDASYTVLAPDHVLYLRHLSVQAGRVEVDIRINRIGLPSPSTPPAGATSIETDLRGYHVVVEVPSGLDRAKLVRLAHDSRLLAIA